MTVLRFLAVALIAVSFDFVEPHAHMFDPPSRTSMWEGGAFPGQPPYYDNFGVWCGNTPQDINYSSCGRCGEPPGGREFSQGGQFGNNIIVKNYTAGSKGVVGTMDNKLELCASETETDSCFQTLQIVGGSEEVRDGNRVCVPCDNCQGEPRNNVRARAQLPAGVRCSRCTLRWTYRTSYPAWGNGDSCDTANANVQTFRNCADIAIV